MHLVSGHVAEEETQRKEGPTGERMCGSGKTPQCGEIIYDCHLHSYSFGFVCKHVLKYDLLCIFPQSLRCFHLVSNTFSPVILFLTLIHFSIE